MKNQYPLQYDYIRRIDLPKYEQTKQNEFIVFVENLQIEIYKRNISDLFIY